SDEAQACISRDMLYTRAQSAGPDRGLNGGPKAVFPENRAFVATPKGARLPCLRSRPSRHAPFFSSRLPAFQDQRSCRGSSRRDRERNEERQENGSLRTCVPCPAGSVAAAGR